MVQRNKIIAVDSGMPGTGEITMAAEVIRTGGVVVIPTFCLYGLAADAFNAAALQKIFDIKKRPDSNPLLIFIKDIRDIGDLVKDVSPAAVKLMNRFWPGKVTLIFNAKDHLPQALTAGTGKIGIRIPDHPVTSALVKAAGCPITGTSANISGQPGCHRVTDLAESLIQNVDLVLDAGDLSGGTGSTVVDTTLETPSILREGVVSASAIDDALK